MRDVRPSVIARLDREGDQGWPTRQSMGNTRSNLAVPFFPSPPQWIASLRSQ